MKLDRRNFVITSGGKHKDPRDRALIAVLVAQVQRQQAEIDELRRRIEN